MKIGVLGAGTWGLALGRMLANNSHDVTMYSRSKEEIDTLVTTHRNKNLKDVIIPSTIAFTNNIEEACVGKDILMIAVPSVGIRSTIASAKDYIPDGQIIVGVAKGIEPDTLYTMSEVIKDELKDGKHDNVKVVALSGPTHAEEVAKDIPTSIVSACEDEEASKIVQDVFMNTCMRVYTNHDVLGVEICGAMKNIIALASGISTGLGFGDNTKAMIITRGMAEIKRLGLAMGAEKDTFSGLAGIGDLIVTATSIHSRNNKCGMLIGQGIRPEDAIKDVGMVVEGINALPAAMKLQEKYNVEMPIVTTVNAIVHGEIDPKDAVLALMTRDKKHEAH